MRRAAYIKKRETKPDARDNNVLVTRFINSLLIQGKKSVAERIFYGAMDVIESKTGTDGLTILKTALQNVKPILEVKSRRVGGATYQVPVEVRQDRRNALALRWLISYARSRPDHTMAERLSAELIAASKNEGGAVKKREDTHKMAEANKAFAHYRW
jgi:small subunit ribosomal protein S7